MNKKLIKQSTELDKKSYKILLQDVKNILAKGEQALTKTEYKKKLYPVLNCTRQQDFNSKISIENKIYTNFKTFFKKVGGDFSIKNHSKVSFKIGDSIQCIDLILYNKSLQWNVLVKITNEKFDSGDVGEMNTNINYYQYNKQAEHEKNTIGLIICKSAGKEDVSYTLGGLEKKIFVATSKSKLPIEDKIKKTLQGKQI